MNVVTCYAAAKIAKVSKQIMSTRKNVNADNKNKYKYFAFDKNSGDFGVDLDHNDWKRYMTKRRSTEAFKNDQLRDTKSQSTDYEPDNTTFKNNLMQAVVDSLREGLGLKGKELKRITGLIESKYEGMG